MDPDEHKASYERMEEKIDEMRALQRSSRRVRFFMGLALLLTVVGLLLMGGG